MIALRAKTLVLLGHILVLSNPIASIHAAPCAGCHSSAGNHLNKQHRFEYRPCATCHMGDEASADQSTAHLGLIASPGNLSNINETCSGCHPAQVKGIVSGVMHTGENIVRTTRQVLEPGMHDGLVDSFQSLGQGIADSMMRKLCASCHLGHTRQGHQPDAVKDRGGGCLACHLNAWPEGEHPMLTRKVEDGRCFGCHSRSGRISLSYAGLAEVDSDATVTGLHEFARLPDRRLLQRQPADVHHKAGMACIDCHTGRGLMGLHSSEQPGGIDIGCNDCHANNNPRIELTALPQQYEAMLERMPFKLDEKQSFLQTSNGTPLIHIEAREDGLLLHPKLGGQAITIPQAGSSHVPQSGEHEKLSCDSCHASWIPTCLGCHMSYDGKDKQWDHTLQAFTSGAWHERRWNTGTGPATLGKLDANTIDVFLPGMIMSLDHPALNQTRSIRRFARISPHTTGPGRSCIDCHRSSVSLGLGKGKLQENKGKLMFDPAMELLGDGLPADAWTSLIKPVAIPEETYPRPLTTQEIEKLYKTLDPAQ